MDCILLVGNRENYHQVANENNKAFLKINGRHILCLMMDELADIPQIDRLLMVGPKERLEALVRETYGTTYPKPILIVEQKRDLLENAQAPLRATEADADPQRCVLYLPSDLPLLTKREVLQFLEKADMSQSDFVTGLVRGETLQRFAPQTDKPGIEMLCFVLSCGSYRVNNMHLVRPNAVGQMDYIREIYSMRYQKKLINGLRLIGSLLFSGVGLTGIRYYLYMRGSTSFRTRGWHWASTWCEKRLKREQGEAWVSKILGTRFKVVTTSFGGTTIDVDNENDYQTVCQRYAEWRELLLTVDP